MQSSQGMQQGLTAPPPGLSPAEVQPSANAVQNVKPSFDSVLAQISTAQDGLGSLQNKLNTKDLQLTNAQKSLLKSKLSSSATHLRGVNEALGVEPPPAPPLQTDKGPLSKIIGYIADGEVQMNVAQAKLSELSSQGKQMNPTEMLLVQSKLNQAQQEIDYSSMLVGKAVTALTQLLNTQL